MINDADYVGADRDSPSYIFDISYGCKGLLSCSISIPVSLNLIMYIDLICIP